MTDTIPGLPREDRGLPLRCVHPDPEQACTEEAAWFVWYAGTVLYTCSCHEHLITRLQDVRYCIVQIKRTPRWEPHS
jgi:hypothetical protein